MSSEKMWKWIAALYKRHQLQMAKKLEPFGIGMGQYHIILIVCESPGIIQDKLTEGVGVNKSTVARAFVQLEENGFLRREVNPADKRAYRLYATEKAFEIRDQILRYNREDTDMAMEGFTEEERAVAFSLIDRMAQNFQCLNKIQTQASATPSAAKGKHHG